MCAVGEGVARMEREGKMTSEEIYMDLGICGETMEKWSQDEVCDICRGNRWGYSLLIDGRMEGNQ